MEHPSYVDDPPIFQMLLLCWIMGGDTLLLLCKQSCVKATGPEAQICSLPMPSVSTMVHGPYSSTILQRVLLFVVTGAKSTRNLQASPNGKVDPDDFEKNLHKIRLGDRFGNLQSSQDGIAIINDSFLTRFEVSLSMKVPQVACTFGLACASCDFKHFRLKLTKERLAVWPQVSHEKYPSIYIYISSHSHWLVRYSYVGLL